MVVIEGLNQHQMMIATLLWTASTDADVQDVISVFGQEAVAVRELIIAAVFDEETARQEEFPEVEELLQNLR